MENLDFVKKLNSVMTFLAILSAVFSFLLTFYSYIYNLSYCTYFGIPIEFVSFSLNNSFISSLFYYMAFFIYIAICFSLVYFINYIIKNPWFNLFILVLLLFFTTVVAFTFWIYAKFDYNYGDVIYYYISERTGNKLLIVFLIFSLVVLFALDSYRIYAFFSERFYEIWMKISETLKSCRNHQNKTKSSIHSKKKRPIVTSKDRNTKINQHVIMFLVTISILVLIYSTYFAVAYGRDNAKDLKEFYLVNDYGNSENSFVKLYGENDMIVVSRYTLATNSIVIDNREIIRKKNIDISYAKYEFKSVNLVKNPDGSMNYYIGILNE